MEHNLFKTEYTDYYVSQEGTVYSKQHNNLVPLSTSIHGGYNEVVYSIGTGEHRFTKWFRVDFLVASTYLANPHGFRFIYHRDGNKLNDKLENLEWRQFCTDEDSRVIEGYNNKYIVTRSGKIFNNFTGQEMKQKNTLGYKMVGLRVFDGKKSIQKYPKVHRLVAEYFIPNPLKLPFVNHKDGNKANNCADNLEWCDNRQNVLHAYRTQLNKTAINLTNGQCVIDLIEDFGYNYNDVGSLLGIDRKIVGNFYQHAYRTYGFQTKNVKVAKHSKKLPLTEEFIDKYKDVICGQYRAKAEDNTSEQCNG